MRLITYHSEVAAGRIARFILTRLCCSQIKSIPDLFQMPFSEINIWTPAVASRSLHSIPCILLSGLSCRLRRLAVLPPSIRVILPFLPSKGKLTMRLADHFVFAVFTKYSSRAVKVAARYFSYKFENFFFGENQFIFGVGYGKLFIGFEIKKR